MTDPALILRLALDGSKQDCMQHLGMTRTRVIQHAITLASDPEIALQHPGLVQRIQQRIEHGRQRRGGQWINDWRDPRPQDSPASSPSDPR